jgi:hypothetical protein
MTSRSAGIVAIALAVLWGWPAAGEPEKSGNTMKQAYFVAPHGSDANPGSIEHPLCSMAGARNLVRQSDALRKQPITVYFREGTYYLPETIVFLPEDSGSSNAPVTYASYNDEKVVISGGSALTGLAAVSRRNAPGPDAGRARDGSVVCERPAPNHGPVSQLR